VSTFSSAEAAACCHLVKLALREDLDRESIRWGDVSDWGDVTSVVLLPNYNGKAAIVARAPGVVAGLPAAALVCGVVDARLRWEPLLEDGAKLEPGTRVAVLSGPLQSLLTAERTALNFLQRLSGVATTTRRYVDAVTGLPCQILDTRKTTPGWRLLEKYAVRCGGGHNHRMGLYDMVLIKDNHLACVRDLYAIEQVISRARQYTHGKLPIEIEVDTLNQLDEALRAGPDMILLDNMTNEQMREAVLRRNAVAPKILLEASGGVTLETVRAIAETGVDRISVGALTHSAPALDIALDYEPA
jgi:nicotinate-nucleotide pyrophosphorylase (carboxylating)